MQIPLYEFQIRKTILFTWQSTFILIKENLQSLHFKLDSFKKALKTFYFEKCFSKV